MSGSTAHGRIPLRAGHRLGFALHVEPAWEREPMRWRAGRIRRRLGDTVTGWRSWSRLHRGYVGPWQDEVSHSGRVLRALTSAPTGAIVAAATTSLPERVGGTRNGDYRYTWVRDASFTLQALATAACHKEKEKFFDFPRHPRCREATHAHAASIDRLTAPVPAAGGCLTGRDGPVAPPARILCRAVGRPQRG
ncbi:glycoside hydrolase family 15 protein [Kitasatospora sp. NPDC087314]|uniref:glycoside hydrolase family 15 protein n=1 Tax=Kitasatospora sp. NPDC087314 TaxID=3364068 RepID=UPI0038108297